MPPKSIFRQPGTKHFQLVHRSQRDPLIHDPDASQHVLKAFVRGNDRKGKTRAELEAILAPEGSENDLRANVGEAALYGVYYDDTEYDYMQHLRPVGTEEEGVESVLIEAPTTSQNKSAAKGKGKAKYDDPISLKDIPADALPSKMEMPRNFEMQQAVPSSIAGFQPDMDPHLRQVLEALEDDAFVNDDVEDGFFTELVREGERDLNEEVDFEFYENGPPYDSISENKSTEDGYEEEVDDTWEARFANFKNEQKDAPPPPDSDSDVHSEGGDTVGDLHKLPVIGGKRRRKGTSDASGYSMSSSSMFRTEALLTLDERFDRLVEKEYGSDDGENLDDDAIETASTSSSLSSSSAPDLVTSREDFATMLDDFMNNYELLGRKLKPVLPGDSGANKLETLRRAMGQDERVRVVVTGEEDEEHEELGDEDLFMGYDATEKEDKWDCETILTTYSNLENHPRLIRARMSKPVPKIKLDPRTGLPSVETGKRDEGGQQLDTLREEEEGPERVKHTITRHRNESKEDKKARKQAVKVERQTRRADKKATKEQFDAEVKHQAQGLSNKTKASRMRKL
ncbi:Low temperature viability protein-domain-containing protein [Melanogaster broomeanus]|nr:Low temperature viability protein-domain-containing protein [Melanogaster broomeanus]